MSKSDPSMHEYIRTHQGSHDYTLTPVSIAKLINEWDALKENNETLEKTVSSLKKDLDDSRSRTKELEFALFRMSPRDDEVSSRERCAAITERIASESDAIADKPAFSRAHARLRAEATIAREIAATIRKDGR
jgi:hypothetical protein